MYIKKFIKKFLLFGFVCKRKLSLKLRAFIFGIYDGMCICNFLKKKVKAQKIEVGFGKSNVLILAPHVDDEILGVGGIIIKHLIAKDTIKIVYMTDGCKSCSKKYSSSEMADIRRIEGFEVSKRLGCQCEFLNANSMEWDTDEFVEALGKTIIEYKPTIIYTVYPFDVNLDHYKTTECLAKTLKETGLQTIIRVYQVQSVLPTRLWGSLVDISSVIETKRECLNIFESQFSMYSSFRMNIRFNKYIAKALGCGNYAEVFHETTAEELFDMVNKSKIYNSNKEKNILIITQCNSIIKSIRTSDWIDKKYGQ